MASPQDQLTKLPVCPICKKEQMTNEEIAKEPDRNKQRCWFCLVDSLVGMNMEEAIPEPADYGRPYVTKEEGIARAQQKYFRSAVPPDLGELLSQMGGSPATGAAPQPTLQQPQTAPAAQAPAKPILQAPPGPIVFTNEQRAEFAAKFGIDPLPKNPTYEITVHGAGEETYMTFGCPVPIGLAESREIQRLMSSLLEIIGKLLKYGAQFASTLIEMQNMAGEMFLGGRR